MNTYIFFFLFFFASFLPRKILFPRPFIAHICPERSRSKSVFSSFYQFAWRLRAPRPIGIAHKIRIPEPSRSVTASATTTTTTTTPVEEEVKFCFCDCFFIASILFLFRRFWCTVAPLMFEANDGFANATSVWRIFIRLRTTFSNRQATSRRKMIYKNVSSVSWVHNFVPAHTLIHTHTCTQEGTSCSLSGVNWAFLAEFFIFGPGMLIAMFRRPAPFRCLCAWTNSKSPNANEMNNKATTRHTGVAQKNMKQFVLKRARPIVSYSYAQVDDDDKSWHIVYVCVCVRARSTRIASWTGTFSYWISILFTLN